jgi:hypothetical protein
MLNTINHFFWLFCGIWCGLGGATFTWQSLRKHVDSGDLSHQEVVSFIKGMVLWFLIPSLLLFGLQLSISGEATPMFLDWPSTQKYIAICLQIFIWLALIYWVFFNDGANTLSKFRGTYSKLPSFLHTPIAFKFLAVLVVLSGLFSLFSHA